MTDDELRERFAQMEQRLAALEAQSEIVVDLMTQVADMVDEWQALKERIVAEDEARLRKG